LSVNISHIEIDTEKQQLLTPEQAWHYRIIPKNIIENTLQLYIDEENNNDTKTELEILFGKKIELEAVSTILIQKTLSVYYRKNALNNSVKTINSDSGDFLINIIKEAKNLFSSDIHIEVYEEKCRIRYRIDGHLIERYVIPKQDYPTLINKIKIKSNLDIAEKRLPQDGRIFYTEGIEKFDIRVSVLPTLYGEKIVMRLLSKDATNIDIEKLGFTKDNLSDYIEAIKKPHGIILISGPTGSGKTTTLYATLKLLNKEKTNILTVEDPIEYTLPGINQVQLKESIGLTFASALKTFLRQDPDVIMVGEIRDAETADIAIRAALTGHLVLSTIHTNSAWGTISRLLDMGIPSYLLASTLNITVAQRLVRLLCTECRKQIEFNEDMLPKTFKPYKKTNKQSIAIGCESCFYTGYKGRKAIYELITIDKEFAEHIKAKNLDSNIVVKEKKINTLQDNAYELFLSGDTTIDEIYPILTSGIQ
jgi:general secretion pathway protein E/type IV pilus assembly protein PilB